MFAWSVCGGVEDEKEEPLLLMTFARLKEDARLVAGKAGGVGRGVVALGVAFWVALRAEEEGSLMKAGAGAGAGADAGRGAVAGAAGGGPAGAAACTSSER
jgi:hypothetical protein